MTYFSPKRCIHEAAIVLVVLSCACSKNDAVRCGPGTKEENGLCVPASSSSMPVASAVDTSAKPVASRPVEELTEEKAKAAAEKLMAKGKALPDNRLGATLKEWHGLVRISDAEMHGKATVSKTEQQLGPPRPKKYTGQYVFHKMADGGWVLDQIEFKSDSGFSSWTGNVFQKVE